MHIFEKLFGRHGSSSAELIEGDPSLADSVHSVHHGLDAVWLESLPINFFRKDTEGRFVAANDRFCLTTGRRRDEIIGCTDFDLYPEELAAKYRADDCRVMETGQMLEDLEEPFRVDGQKIYVQVLKGPVFDQSGEVVGSQGMFWDVSDRRRAETERDQLFSVSIDLMCVAGSDGYFKRLNPAFEKALGFTQDELLSRPFLEFVHPDDRESTVKELQSLAVGVDSVDFENRYRCKDGGYRWLAWSCPSPRHGETLLYAVARDITERKRVAHELETARREAEQASRAKGEFLANMSHEIRSPMNAVIGLAQILLDSPLSDDQYEQLTLLLESAQGLVTLIDDVLDFSKIEAGRLQIDPQPFRLRKCLTETLRSLSVRAAEKGLELNCDVHEEAPDVLIGDYPRIRQVLVNLVSNAINYTDRGCVTVTVGTRLQSDNRMMLEVCVRDTGLGIEKDKLKSIFRPFEQADVSTPRNFGGTGLGLAICKKLVESLGGQIGVESSIDKGSTFFFTAHVQTTSGEEARPSVDSDGSPSTGQRILVGHTDDDMRARLLGLLTGWQFDVQSVSSADEVTDAMARADRQGEPFAMAVISAELAGAADGRQLPVIVFDEGRTGGDHSGFDGLVATDESDLYDKLVAALDRGSSDNRRRSVLAGGDPTRPLSILLAEDGVVNQKVAIGLLSKRGHQVTVADNGNEALRRWSRGRFDLILMDVQMPEMDGLQTTRAIRKAERQRGGHTPIVALTARAMTDDRQRCMEAGMDAFLPKPIQAEELYRTIETAVQVRKVVCEAENSKGADRAETIDVTDTDLDFSYAVQELGGDEELLREMIRVGLEENDNLLRQIRAAVAADDSAIVKRAAHTMKGNFRYFGQPLVYQLALRLEEMGDSRDLANAPEATDELDRELLRLNSVLVDFVNEDDML